MWQPKREKHSGKKLQQEGMFVNCCWYLVKVGLIYFCFSLWLQVGIYKTVRMHCIWHKQMVSSYYFYQKQIIKLFWRSLSEKCFRYNAMNRVGRDSRKIDWFQWNVSRRKKFRVPTGIAELEKTLSLYLRYQLMRIQVTRYII